MNNEDISLQTITPNPPADFTPSLVPYAPLRPFRYWCQKVLPLVYDDSLSYYELLCKVIDFLNKTMEDVESLHIDVTNLYNAYVQLQQYINDYFKNLNVQEEINNKLDEMVKDGTLDTILRNAFIRDRMLNLEFLGRTFSVKKYISEDNQCVEKDFPSAQGMCTRVINGVVHIYTCYYNYSSGSEQESVIQDMLLDGTVIKTSKPMPLDHSNDICYNSKKNVFVVCGYGIDKAYEINADTLELNTIYSLGGKNIISITYDYDSDVYYTYMSQTIRQWNTDFSDSTIVSQGTFVDHYGVETIEYKTGLLYIVQNQPNTLTVMDKHSWNVRTVMMLQDFASDYYPIGEVQAISIYNNNGDFVMTGKPRHINPVTRSTEVGYAITAFMIGNVYKNTTYVRRFSQPSITPFVGGCTINGNLKVFKPTGTQEAPFYTLGDAVICLDAPLYKPQTINLESDFDEDFSLLDTKISLQGFGHTVKSLTVYNFSGYINNIKVTNDCNLIRCNGVVNNITVNGNKNIEQCNIGYYNVDFDEWNINTCALTPIYQNRTILDTTFDDNNSGITESLSENINHFHSVTITLLDKDRGRIIDKVNVKVKDSNNGFYLSGYDGLTDDSKLYRVVVIINSATTVTIAGTGARVTIVGE